MKKPLPPGAEIKRQLENDPALPLARRLKRMALGERLREENRPGQRSRRDSGEGMSDADLQLDADFAHDHLMKQD